jgi:hypothetical protein
VSLRSELGLGVTALGMVLGVAGARLWVTGRAAALEAERAAAHADWVEAVVRARTAAQSYVPGSPWPDRGKRLLQSIGESAAVRGDRPTALRAFGALRAAAISTSPFGATERPWRRVAEDGLERLAEAHAAGGGTNLGAVARASLAAEAAPVGPLTVASLAAAGWALAAGVWLRSRAATSSRAARFAGALTAGAFAAYGLALLLR